MKSNGPTITPVMKRLFLKTLVFITTSICVLGVVQVATLFWLLKGGLLEPHNLLSPVLTLYLIPAIVIIGILSAGLYRYFAVHVRSLGGLMEAERQRIRREAATEVFQRVTTLLAEHIGRDNAEIRKWVEARRRNGSVPERVDRASMNIGRTMAALSRVSYLLPHIDSSPSGDDFTGYLELSLGKRDGDPADHPEPPVSPASRFFRTPLPGGEKP